MARVVAFCAGAGVSYVGCNILLDTSEQYFARVLRGVGLVKQKSSHTSFNSPVKESNSAEPSPIERIVERIKNKVL